MNPDWELATERLRLLPCIDEHLDGLHAIDSDPQVMRYITGRPYTRAETANVIERVKARWATVGYSWWSFIESASGQIVGAGCVQNLRHSGSEPDLTCPIEIGWRVRRDKWRQGIASEAAQAMAQFAFQRLGIEVLYAVCNPENQASMAVMKKLGMRRRGLEGWYAQQLMVYEMTASEWRTAVTTVGQRAAR